MTDQNILDNLDYGTQDDQNILDNHDNDTGNTSEATEKQENEAPDTPEATEAGTGDAPEATEQVVPKSRYDQVYKQNQDLESRLSKYIDQQTGYTPEIENKPKPTVDDFENHDDFVEALTDWKVDQKYKTHTVNQQEHQRKLEKSNMETSIEAKVQDALKLDPQFSAKAYIPAEMVDLVYDSHKFAELAYFFGENKNLAIQLCRAPKHIAAREIGRIEAQLESVKAPEPKVKSSAPRTSNPIDGPAAKTAKDPDDMNDKEFDEWYNQNFNPYYRKK